MRRSGKIQNGRSHCARRGRIRDALGSLGQKTTQRDVRAIQRALAGQEITIELVSDEVRRANALRARTRRERLQLERFNQAARGEYRMVDGSWEAKIHLDVARTGIALWIRMDRVRASDLETISKDDPEPSELRAIAGRLRSAARLAADPLRRRCSEMDAAGRAVASDEDLVFVRTAMRQLRIETVEPSEILNAVEKAHARALERSMAVAGLAADPHEIEGIMGLDVESRPKRRILAFVGPTNSGKTHAAIEMLKQARTGAYLAPLRLMAMENHDRLRQAGVATSMRTGEETIEIEGATHVSATVEMATIETHQDVVVVDESQLLDDPNRGWAWTRAIFHQRCGTMIVTGSPDCLPILRRIAFLTGESVEIRAFERRAPLSVMDSVVDFKDLRKGDAVIAFSRNNVLAIKAEISRIENPMTGRPFRVAMIYGTLGPEVRRSEAARFSCGDAEILVATDAIGMGLNLPIDRVIFSTMAKYDGFVVRDLQDSEIRQIGGRAGRHGQEQGGKVGLLKGAGGSLKTIAVALASKPKPASDPRPYILPTVGQIERGMDALEVDLLSKALPAVSAVLRNGPDYRCHVHPETIDLLQTIEQFDIPLRDKHAWIGCPMPLRDQANRRVVEEWAAHQQDAVPVHLVPLECEEGVEIDDHRLQDIERAVTQAGAYMWLSRRWPRVFSDVPVASSIRRDGNRMIEDALRQRHIHRKCQECGTPIGFRVHHRTCRKCAFG
jgi:ATP-dependent RNA helicase SUPV3L1/SUV3